MLLTSGAASPVTKSGGLGWPSHFFNAAPNCAHASSYAPAPIRSPLASIMVCNACNRLPAEPPARTQRCAGERCAGEIGLDQRISDKPGVRGGEAGGDQQALAEIPQRTVCYEDWALVHHRRCIG